VNRLLQDLALAVLGIKMGHRQRTDRRDGTTWMLWIERDKPALAFESGGEGHGVEVDFDDEPYDWSDEDLQRLPDEARGPMKLAEGRER